MTRRIFSTTILLLLAGGLTSPTFGESVTVPEPAALHAGAAMADTVHVAPPTGEPETDRASILAALEEVEPGGTVLFGLGTYLVGTIIPVPQSGITLQAHPGGTTLRGCDPGVAGESVLNCGVMVLQGGGVTLRGFTIEQSRLGVCISDCRGDPQAPVGDTVGGYRIEDNTFRNSLNGVRGQVVSSDTSLIRDNRFVNTFHAVSFLEASHLQVVDNRISAPEPEEMPGLGHVSFAIALGGDSNLIARNRIEGHPDGILLAADPAGSSSGNVIRGNTIEVARHRLPDGGSPALASSDPADSTIVGVPLALHGRRAPSDTIQAGRLSDNLVQDNRILGAEGIGIELTRASGNRIVGNQVSGIVPRRSFPGNSVSTDPAPWREANGSAIWVSPGSDSNQIVGNTFEDVAGAAVFLEGDDNRVELRSASDSIRDLGSSNEVTAADSAGAAAHSYWRPLNSPDRASARLSRSPDGTLFAGTSAGLFVSEDLGRSWRLRGSANRHVLPPLVTPEGAVLAGSYRQGILRSTDGGRTWTPVGFERNIYTGSLVRDREGRIYARARGAVEDEPTGIFRSDDDGRSWTAAGLADEEVYDVSIPRPGILFAGTENGLFRSEDGGDTWSPAGELPYGAPVSEIVAHRGELFASMGAPLWRIPGGGVARSRDGGGTWEPAEGLPAGAAVQDLVVHGEMLFAAVGDLRRDEGRGLYRLDAGGQWRPSGLDDVRLMSLLSSPDGLFAGAREVGVFRSEDGRSWTRRSEGFRNWVVPSLAVGTDGTLYGLTARGLFRSADRGRTWTSTPRPEGSALPTPSSMIVPSEGRLLLAGRRGVLVSDDGGASWEGRPIPGEEGEVFALSAGPGGEVFAVVRREAAYVSPNEGRSWRRLDLPGAPVRALFSSPSGARFATTAGGFHRWSGDGSWEEVSGEHVWAVTACGEALIAGAYARGLLRSTDDGRTWLPVTEELRVRSQQSGYLSFTALACLPDGGVLAGTFWDGVFYSPDAGETWREATAGLPAESVQDFAVSPDGRVFVSTPAGVFVNVALPDA